MTSSRKKNEIDVTVPPFELSSIDQPCFLEAISSVAELLKSRKKILVLAGAGISVSCGIPDFRSPEGLYANLDIQELGLTCPEDLFDLEYFHDDPRPFYKFAKALYFPLGGNKLAQPSDSHRFLALLEQQGKLLRVYTQNIDGLEEVAGVSSKRMVYAHGSLHRASCLKCKQKVDASAIERSVQKGEVARCQVKLKSPKPAPVKSTRIKRKRSSTTDHQLKRIRTRSSNDESECVTRCRGVLKPNVTFFGETLQDNVRRRLEADRDKADALIVIGTSLSVAPMSKVIQYLPPNIPRILINRTIVTAPSKETDEEEVKDNEEQEFREKYTFDAYLLGFCDDVTRALVQKIKLGKSWKDASGQLLAAVRTEEAENIFVRNNWEAVSIPHQRILLFPGAIAPTGEEDVTDYIEVAHCDGCQKQIIGKVRKCIQCFDFDLCQECYPKVSKKHFGGNHRFVIER